MTRRILGRFLGRILGPVLAVLAVLAPGGAAHAVEIPGLAAYRNDMVRQDEAVRLCAVTLVLANAAGDETVEFRLLASDKRFGFKLSAAAFDPAARALRPYRLADADFSAPAFAYDRPFGKRATLTGQVVAMLGEAILARDYLDAFFAGRFYLQFRREGRDSATRYLVFQPPGETVRRTFGECLKRLHPD
ncbi:MAG: hypothetical protein U1E53_22780 [Dongiaceae bacterium]